MEDLKNLALKNTLNLIFNNSYNERDDKIYMYLIENPILLDLDSFNKYTSYSEKGTFFYEENNKWLTDFYYLFFTDNLKTILSFTKSENNKPKKGKTECYYLRSYFILLETIKKYVPSKYEISIFDMFVINNISKLCERYDIIFLKFLGYVYYHHQHIYDDIAIDFIENYRYTNCYIYIMRGFYK